MMSSDLTIKKDNPEAYIERQDTLEVVANIADLRCFRTSAMETYDEAILDGLSAQKAHQKAIDVVNMLNKGNER